MVNMINALMYLCLGYGWLDRINVFGFVGFLSLEQECSVFSFGLLMKTHDHSPLFRIPSYSVILGC